MAINLGLVVIIGLIILSYYIVRWIIDREKNPKENCSKCGTKLIPEDRFCPECGKRN